MPTIEAFQLYSAELPFRKPFRHAAAVRTTSSSLFLECRLDDGAVGFGESLPRDYVTGETRDDAVELLRRRVLPRLLERSFADLDEVRSFLADCDGKAPADWVDPDQPQTAAWCAVDLALLDAFGRSAGEPALPSTSPPEGLRYSTVISADKGWRVLKTTFLSRAMGLRSAKIKVDGGTDAAAMRRIRWSLGSEADIRVDANMGWTVEQAEEMMTMMAELGIHSFEQPLAASDLEGAAHLVRSTGLDVMADESLSDRTSLDRLLAAKACTEVNVRLSKCGGLVASIARCRQALEAGLTVQVGCQVGESSLSSSAQLDLVSTVREVRYLEGAFGQLLLRRDPAMPLLQFGRGGRPPERPPGPGFGITVDRDLLTRHSRQRIAVPAGSR